MSAIWLILGLLICWSSYRMNVGSLGSPGPGFVPLLSGLLMTIASAAILFQSVNRRFWKESTRRGYSFLFSKKVALVFFILVAYMMALSYLGFFLCTLFFMALLLKVASQTWKTIAAGSFCTAAGAYLLFRVFLKSDLPVGILGF